jgi:hypothetical protein
MRRGLVDREGGLHDDLKRDRVLFRAAPAVFILWRSIHFDPVQQTDFYSDFAPLGFDVYKFAIQAGSAFFANPDPERGGLAKQQLLQWLCMRTIAQNSNQRSQPVFLHVHRRAHHIQSASL